MNKHILSKSTFMYGTQCPLRLYLHKFRPELRNPEDEGQQMIFSTGTNVGLIARDVFPGGIDVSPPDPFSYHISVAKTQQLIRNGEKIIYEAAFNFNEVLCAIDILVKKPNGWYAYEVKSVNNVKAAHVMDAALQYFVISNSGIALKDFSILHFNRDYIKRGALDVNQLFKVTSVLSDLIEEQDFIKSKSKELKKILLAKKQPAVEPGNHCSKPYECDFTNHCWKNIAVEKPDYGSVKINKSGIKTFLKELIYPLHFFDFETVGHAVPVYDESRPYQAVPFQYSLHYKENKKTEITHLSFLGDGVNDPREELIRKMIEHLGDKGSILVWYKPFEASKLKDLARDFPKYSKQINKILDRLVDLRDPFKNGHYRHPEFEGSTSIKNVLPVLIPELTYSTLSVQDGMMATMTYSTLSEQPMELQAKLRNDLLEYCHLDTLAMVRIFEKLNNIK